MPSSYYYETKVEVDKNGKPLRTYHLANSGKAWTHPIGDPYMMDSGKKLPCPVCKP